MKELLEHIVKAIVNNPEAVSVEEKESIDFPGLTILTIDVAEEDKGVVIGRRGRTINSIRDLITINAIRNDKRVKVLIKDDNHEKSSRENTEDTDGMLVDEEL
jgi:hypothetical protein